MISAEVVRILVQTFRVPYCTNTGRLMIESIERHNSLSVSELHRQLLVKVIQLVFNVPMLVNLGRFGNLRLKAGQSTVRRAQSEFKYL